MRKKIDWKGINMIYQSTHSDYFFGTWFCVENKKKKLNTHKWKVPPHFSIGQKKQAKNRKKALSRSNLSLLCSLMIWHSVFEEWNSRTSICCYINSNKLPQGQNSKQRKFCYKHNNHFCKKIAGGCASSTEFSDHNSRKKT